MHPLEIFAAQGLDLVATGTYLPQQLLIKAANNADPPNALAPYLCPIIHAIAEWGGLEAWPNPKELLPPGIATKKASLFKWSRKVKKGSLKKPARRPIKARKVILKKPVGRPSSLKKTRAT